MTHIATLTVVSRRLERVVREGHAAPSRVTTWRSFPEAVPMSVWQEIVAKAVEDARKGDHAARAWLAGYLCGKPTGDALRNLAVDEEVGVDPLAEQISQKELMAIVLGVMKKS